MLIFRQARNEALTATVATGTHPSLRKQSWDLFCWKERVLCVSTIQGGSTRPYYDSIAIVIDSRRSFQGRTKLEAEIRELQRAWRRRFILNMPDSVNLNKNEDVAGENILSFLSEACAGRRWERYFCVSFFLLWFRIRNPARYFQTMVKTKIVQMWLTCMVTMLFKNVCFDGYILEIFLIILTSNHYLH